MTRAVLRKELAVLWLSPVPYVVGALLNLVLAVLYVEQLELRRQALVQPLFPVAGFLLVGAAPLVAMRSVADEARTGALDLLLAIPVAARPLVVGKWLAAWLSSLAALAPALLFAGLLEWWGDPDWGPVAAGFLGLALLAGTLTALGVAASATTTSQPVAAMVTLFVGLLLWFSHVGSETLTAGAVLAHFSLSERLRTFAGGLLTTGDVGFFVLAPLAALLLATAVVESRRSR